MAEPLLRVENLVTAFDTDRGVMRGGGRRVVRGAGGRDAGGGRRERLRQERDRAERDAAGADAAGRDPGRADRVPGTRSAGAREREMRAVRGDQISMIFQEPMTSLNPVFTVGGQIVEAIRIHRKTSRRAARERAVQMLELVGIPSAAERVDSYPHQLSGGMRQRVMIAMALVVRAGAADRRRADDRARRDDPGADPRSAGAAAERARHGHRVHHARSRRGGRVREPRGGDVRRARGRDGAGRGAVRAIRAIPTRAACSRACRRWTSRRAPATAAPADHRGHGAGPREPARGLPLRRSLRALREQAAGTRALRHEEPELVAVGDGRLSRCYYAGEPA